MAKEPIITLNLSNGWYEQIVRMISKVIECNETVINVSQTVAEADIETSRKSVEKCKQLIEKISRNRKDDTVTLKGNDITDLIWALIESSTYHEAALEKAILYMRIYDNFTKEVADVVNNMKEMKYIVSSLSALENMLNNVGSLANGGE